MDGQKDETEQLLLAAGWARGSMFGEMSWGNGDGSGLRPGACQPLLPLWKDGGRQLRAPFLHSISEIARLASLLTGWFYIQVICHVNFTSFKALLRWKAL